MKMRKITSLTALLAFVIMILTSFVLYIVPQGRIAYWAAWKLWGLTKTEWGDIHINTGILFLAALGLHTYYNWKPIMNYLKDKTKTFKLFTREFNTAGIIVVVFVAGTYLGLPPFSSILNLSTGIKDTSAKKYGEPPYGHAELSSIKIFTKKMNLNIQESITKLKEAGISVRDENQTIFEISEQYKISPQQIYLIIKNTTDKSAAISDKGEGLPDSAPGGTGNLTIADLCSQFNLDINTIVQGLSKMGINAQENMTLKEISKDHQTNPTDIYENIKEIVKTSTNPQ